MAAEPRGIPLSQVNSVVNDFLVTQLRLRGHVWTPEARDEVDGVSSATTMNEVQRKRITDAITRINSFIEEDQNGQIAYHADKAIEESGGDLQYRQFWSIAQEMFAEGTRWSLIITLLVFSSELAYKVGVVRGQAEFINEVSSMCTRFLTTSPSVASWIQEHDWEEMIALGNRQNDEQDGQAAGHWGSRIILAVTGSLGVLVAFSLMK